MSLLSMIGFKGASFSTPHAELPEIFPFPCREAEFIANDVETIFQRILTEVLERTQGIPDDRQPLLWDNCLANESSDGLVSMLAKAMAEKKDLFLVYDPGIKLIRQAKDEEKSQIREDYKKNGQSKAGVYITFSKYKLAEMLKIYSALEYYTISSLYKSMNLSKAVQLKFYNLRASISTPDASAIVAQAMAIAEALKNGKDVAIDEKDVIQSLMPDITAASASIDFINQKRSFYLGLPAAYITGLSNKGLGDSGAGEAKAVERGLKRFYFAIIKPVIEQMFSISTSFKSEDYESLTTALSALQSFEITGDEYLSTDNKRLIVGRLFGVDSEAEPKR